MDEFESVWWPIYPHKVGKGHARTAFARARKKASLEQLVEGVKVYIKNKPDWQAWCNPATWLNGERWLDEYAPKPGSFDTESFNRAWNIRAQEQSSDDVRYPPRKDH